MGRNPQFDFSKYYRIYGARSIAPRESQNSRNVRTLKLLVK